MLKDYIGGEARRNGILFYGLTHKVTGTRQGIKVAFYVKQQKKSRQLFANVPFIRGITGFYPFIFLNYIFVTNPTVRPGLILTVIVMLFWHFNRNSREYHGAEHMVVNAYLADLDITDIENIKQQSMLSRRCGSAFLILFVFLSLIMWPVAFIPAWVVALLLPAITYEIHTAEKDSLLVRSIMKIALSIQKLVVAPPSDEQLQLASQTLHKLIEHEEKQIHKENGSDPADDINYILL